MIKIIANNCEKEKKKKSISYLTYSLMKFKNICLKCKIEEETTDKEGEKLRRRLTKTHRTKSRIFSENRTS